MTKPLHDDHTLAAIHTVSEQIKKILGPDGFCVSKEKLSLLSEDIWAQGQKTAFIASPSNIEELSQIIRTSHKHGVSINPRGAGMSYTKGYTPDRPGVGILDFSRLDRIIEINTEDMYVTVEAGCSWHKLYEALKEKGVRTPFWGPLSGLTSTIGGGLSQNNAFFGAGTYGTTADSVLSVTVVLGDGTIVRTGSAGTKNGKPFFRYYGPDLTGLFCGDAGAFGYKAEVTFKLIPLPEQEDWASYEFPTRDSCAQAMARIMRENIACELFGFDPNLQRLRMKRASIAADVKTLGNVIKGQGSVLKGLKEGAKIALAGRTFVDDAAYSLHFTVEGRSGAGVSEEIGRLKAIAEQFQGKAIENSIPKIIRSNPFTPLTNILGPEGERWVPIHGIVPTSEGPKTFAELEAVFEAMKPEFDKHNVSCGFLITNVGATGYLIEPVFIWPEQLFTIHEQTVGEDHIRKLKRFDANPEATAVVEKARQAVLNIFSDHGAVHFQIGRTYPYKEKRHSETWDLIEKIKSAVDAEGIINPGALGLLEVPSTQPQTQTIQVRNPRTGKDDYSFAPITPDQLKDRSISMRAAQKKWAALTLAQRSQALSRLAVAVRENDTKLSNALELDTGRRRIALMETQGVIASLEGWIAKSPELLPTGWTVGKSRPDFKHAPQFVPYGLVGVISPWNFPLTLSMIDTIPALLAGCAVLIKPSEITPRFAAIFELIIREAGLDDVLGFAMGDGAVGAELINRSDAICFTGSVPTGRKVARACAERLIPAFLELGGKDPLVVLKSADLENASNAALRGSVLATGQACQSIERIYVDRSVHEEFLNLLTAKAKNATLNYPDIDKGQIGPIIFDPQAEVLKLHIDDAIAKGATILTGGTIETHGGGKWLRPTVLSNVDHTMLVMREETFGPILPVMAFDTPEEAVALANDTQFGLSAAVMAGSLEEAEAFGSQINAGAISLNDAALTALFHEAEKQSFGASGIGPSRMGPSGFHRFFRRKALIANTGAPSPLDQYAENATY